MEGKFEGTTPLCAFVTCVNNCFLIKKEKLKSFAVGKIWTVLFIAKYGEKIYVILYGA
jgi:hypothetical protein